MRSLSSMQRGVLGVVVACAATAFAAPSYAQPAATDIALQTHAQELYQQGRERFFANDFQGAREAFQASLDRADSPNTRMYLGRALQRLGRLSEAWAMLDRAARDADARVASEPRYQPTRDSARAEADALAPGVAWLTIDVPDAPDDVSVSVNDHATQRGGLGIAAPMDPGDVEIVARAAGFREERRALTLAPGAHEAVSIALERLPPATSTGDAGAPALDAGVEPPRRASPLRTAGAVTMIAGGATVLAGGVFLLLAWNTNSELSVQQEQSGGIRDADVALRDAGVRNRDAGWVLASAGVATLAVGMVMYLRGQRAPSRAPALTVFAGPGAGLGLGGRF